MNLLSIVMSNNTSKSKIGDDFSISFKFFLRILILNSSSWSLLTTLKVALLSLKWLLINWFFPFEYLFWFRLFSVASVRIFLAASLFALFTVVTFLSWSRLTSELKSCPSLQQFYYKIYDINYKMNWSHFWNSFL
jgi:hypothetical protein